MVLVCKIWLTFSGSSANKTVKAVYFSRKHKKKKEQKKIISSQNTAWTVWAKILKDVTETHSGPLSMMNQDEECLE